LYFNQSFHQDILFTYCKVTHYKATLMPTFFNLKNQLLESFYYLFKTRYRSLQCVLQNGFSSNVEGE